MCFDDIAIIMATSKTNYKESNSFNNFNNLITKNKSWKIDTLIWDRFTGKKNLLFTWCT